MKTLRNLFVLIVCLLMIVPTGTAYAANTEDYQFVDVYVNNQLVDADVYVDNNIAWVANYSQLYIIFPEETRNFNFPAVQDASSLKNWAIRFNYTLEVTHNAVYLSNKDTVITIPEPTIPPITIPENVKLYINGMFVSDVSSSVEVKAWADSCGYTYIQKGSRIYLSDTGVTPIEIYLNSAIIDFPDQQPIILNNRTMIPIRAVSESLGWNVSWGENVVTITNNSHTLILYIGKNYYTIDSVKKTMDVPAQIVNNRTMVPIRFVAEAFGYNVGYDGSGSVKVVTINK